MVGIRPPTKEQFNYLFYNIDEKMAFLLEEIDSGGSVKTTGNQEIAGDKTFTGLTTLKKGAIVADSVGDFNANQYLQIGSNNVNSYFYNKRSGKYLSMRNDGELRYDGKRLLNVDDLAGMIPSGAVMYFAGRNAPTGWLKANGAAVSRTTYAALFAAIGTTYGAGDGRSTFNLPDLRAEFLRGWDDGRGIDSGRAFGSAQSDAIRNIKGSLEALYGSQRYTLYTKAEGAFATDSDDGANASTIWLISVLILCGFMLSPSVIFFTRCPYRICYVPSAFNSSNDGVRTY